MGRPCRTGRTWRLGDVAHTAGVGRSHFPQRLAVVADTVDSGGRRAPRLRQRRLASGIAHRNRRAGSAPLKSSSCLRARIPAYPDMGRQLYDTSGVYRDAVDRCDRLIGPDASGRTLRSVLWPSPNDETLADEPVWAG